MLVEVHEEWQYKVLGGTQDDAAGEVYDKGREIPRTWFPRWQNKLMTLAQNGDPLAVKFPRPMRNTDDYQSVSAVSKRRCVILWRRRDGAGLLVENGQENAPSTNPDMITVEDIAAVFKRLSWMSSSTNQFAPRKPRVLEPITLTGGVAANSQLRTSLRVAAAEIGAEVYYPPMNLCTDNGAMIAGIAYQKYQQGLRDELSFKCDSKWIFGLICYKTVARNVMEGGST